MNIETAGYIQAERILRVGSPLGEDILLPERVEIREEIGAFFEIVVNVRSKQLDIAPHDIVGKHVDVSLELGEGLRRPWHALCTDLRRGPRITRALHAYQLTLRPEWWLLTQHSDCRIWMDKDVLEIARILASEHGITAPITAGVIAPPPPQHYSVQWNETDWDFLARRMEEDGLFFWFEHEEGQHVMHVADHPSGYTEGEETDVRLALGSADRNRINGFERHYRYTPGKRAGRDWNFETPTIVPGGDSPSLVSLPRNGGHELYEFPARALDDAAVTRMEKLRMQATEHGHELVDGRSDLRTLAPGRLFKPYNVANSDDVYEMHVTRGIVHRIVDRSYETAPDEPEYANEFLAMPSRVPATPHRETHRPRIEGAQVAIVAGPEGEEIHPNGHGCIKVWFPWDRRAVKDGSDTCWIRVMQNWAGTGWGGQVIPRIGMEVMVNFLEGDPDRPIVTGVVPNPRQKVPYALPEHKTKSVFRSDTHKGQGRNEFTFEDEAGQENMYFHAQKDQTTRVLNDRTKRVDRHEVSAVGQNRTVEVGANQKHEIGGSMNLVVGGTGPLAIALTGAVNGLAGHTASLVKQAGDVAGGVGGIGIGAFASTLASSALGFFGMGGLFSRNGVVNGGDPSVDAGRALGDSGSGVGEAASGLFPLPGIMNTVVGAFKSDTIGVAGVEQIGVSKVSNVGVSAIESVGKYKKIAVGEEFVIECGDSKFIMKSNGEVIILGKTFNFHASDHFQMRGDPIDLN
ncbi:MAG: type VI secretion system tip protein TssI/VgrG [Pseudomonadota bacterium]